MIYATNHPKRKVIDVFGLQPLCDERYVAQRLINGSRQNNCRIFEMTLPIVYIIMEGVIARGSSSRCVRQLHRNVTLAVVVVVLR